MVKVGGWALILLGSFYIVTNFSPQNFGLEEIVLELLSFVLVGLATILPGILLLRWGAKGDKKG
jgi:hypothetical protein